MTDQQHLEPLGNPDDAVDPTGDFADEHDDTAVDDTITEGNDRREEESPRGWDGMDRDGPP
jgi:hypothetical protein